MTLDSNQHYDGGMKDLRVVVINSMIMYFIHEK